MERGARRRKKILEAYRLRDVTPEDSVRSAARMIAAARRIAEAGRQSRTESSQGR